MVIFYQNYIIFEGFIPFWMIAFSFLANFAVKPGFLHIFLNKSATIAAIYVSMAAGATFIFAHDLGNLMYFLNISTFIRFYLIHMKSYEQVCRQLAVF